MSFSAATLFSLLPAVLRGRDRERVAVTPGVLAPAERSELATLLTKQATNPPLTALETERLAYLQKQALAGPLQSMLAVFAEQVAVLEEDLAQLYDDQFIETCAPWVTPYIGDLIGYRLLHGVTPSVASPRADVAHTIAYRRRKGTITVLEQLAHDVTGWHAAAAESFQHLAMTQYMNHVRPQALATPDLRRWEPLEHLGSAFDRIAHTVDVRRIASGRGRYNLPNVPVFLWRLDAYALTASPAVPVPGDDRRWRFHPLGIDQPLVTKPMTIAPFSQRTTPLAAPVPISRRVLHERLGDYYGPDSSTDSVRVEIASGGGAFILVPIADICVCNLADLGPGWAHQPSGATVAIDPVLGRLALGPLVPVDTTVRVSFHYAFSAPMGGGGYPRAETMPANDTPPQLLRVPDDHPTIQAALTALGGAGIVEITDHGRYEETLTITVDAEATIELRAADRCRPTLVLGGPLVLSGGMRSQIRLEGLLIAGNGLDIPDTADNRLAKLAIRHCTLVPGWTLAPDSTPTQPGAVSLRAAVTPKPPLSGDDVPSAFSITIAHSICGALRVAAATPVAVQDSIIDATIATEVAYAGLDGNSPGGDLRLDACTVVGKVAARALPLVTNSILIADLRPADPWIAPVIAARRQDGCIRFSYLPGNARVPRRYRCLPESAPSAALAAPRFTTLRYGFAAYAQLATSAGARLLTAADDECQPGAFHGLFEAQRETNLRVRLDEYLRTGLEAGIRYES